LTVDQLAKELVYNIVNKFLKKYYLVKKVTNVIIVLIIFFDFFCDIRIVFCVLFSWIVPRCTCASVWRTDSSSGRSYKMAAPIQNSATP